MKNSRSVVNLSIFTFPNLSLSQESDFDTEGVSILT